jgi:hypothetical protein
MVLRCALFFTRALRPIRGRRRACGAWLAFLAAALFVAPAPGHGAAGKIDTSGFTAYYAAQSQALHVHLGRVVDAYADLARRGAVGPMKDVLAARGTLSACWELFLNAGDMVYIYDRIDPSCEKSVKGVGDLLRAGMAVVAGKIEKELQWLDVSIKNLKGQPITGELTAAAKDFRDTAAALRRFSVDFAKPVPPAEAPSRPGSTPGVGRPGAKAALPGPAAPQSPVVPGAQPGGTAPGAAP